MGFTLLNESNFAESVFTSNKPVFIQFSADWCGVCHHIEPQLNQLSEDFDGKVEFVKVDVAENMDLADKFSINSLPTFLIIADHEIKGQIIGAESHSNFTKILNDAINGQL